MPRLPQPGSDNGTWGEILNEYLSQSLKSNGAIRDNAVTNSAIAPNAITGAEIADGSINESQLAVNVRAKLNTPIVSSWDDIPDKPAVVASGVDAASARIAINAYTLPDTGIPQNDLSSDVQAKLNRESGFVRPEEFGAPTDGITAASSALQAAVDAIADGVVSGALLLARDYALDVPLIVKSGVRIVGLSGFNRRTFPNTFNGGHIYPTDNFVGQELVSVGTPGNPDVNPQAVLFDGVNLSGRHIDGTYHSNLAGLRIHDTSDVRFINGYIGGFDRSGNVGRGMVIEGSGTGNCYGTTIINSVISDCFEGVLFSGDGTTDNRISDSLILGCTRGISLGWDDRTGSEVNLGGGGTQIINTHFTYPGMPSGGHHLRTGSQAGDGTFSNLYFDMAGNTYTIRLGNGKNVFNGCHFLVADTNTREGLIRLTTSGSQQLSVIGCNVNLQNSGVKSLVWYSAKSGIPTGGVISGNVVYGAGSGGAWISHAINSTQSNIANTDNGSFYLGGNVRCT